MGEKRVQKEQIYLARTYRHLRVNKWQSIAFIGAIVVPTLVAMLWGYGKLTEWMVELARSIFEQVDSSMWLSYEWHEFIPGLGWIKSLVVETTWPSTGIVIMNIVIAAILLVVSRYGRKKVNPMAIYIGIVMIIHLINSVFFLIVGKKFPYAARDFSDLYMKQQIGIWICFILISGVVVGLLGRGSILTKITTFFVLNGYSVCFGTLRYIVFLFIIYKYSILYMAIFFFVLGPFYDFLYLVCIYSIYTNKMMNRYHSGKGRDEWSWS